MLKIVKVCSNGDECTFSISDPTIEFEAKRYIDIQRKLKELNKKKEICNCMDREVLKRLPYSLSVMTKLMDPSQKSQHGSILRAIYYLSDLAIELSEIVLPNEARKVYRAIKLLSESVACKDDFDKNKREFRSLTNNIREGYDIVKIENQIESLENDLEICDTFFKGEYCSTLPWFDIDEFKETLNSAFMYHS